MGAWLSAEAILARRDLHLRVSACRPRGYRKRWIASLHTADDLVLYGEPAESIAVAIENLRAEYVTRVGQGWRPEVLV